MKRLRLFATLLLVFSPSAFAANIYSQPFDGSGTAYLSQNDISGGWGLIAQVLDNFTVGTTSTIDRVLWTGECLSSPQKGKIAGWTVQFWSDSAGQPGSLLFSQYFVGDGGETYIGTFDVYFTYTYGVSINPFVADAGARYWLSVIPDLGYPFQWGWSTATGGDHISYWDSYGSRTKLDADMAFTLVSNSVPEPTTILMLGSGLLALGKVHRKRF